MKRDICINFDLLDTVIYNINQYYEALFDMEVSLAEIRRILGNNTGKLVEALMGNDEELKTDFRLCKGERGNFHVKEAKRRVYTRQI